MDVANLYVIQQIPLRTMEDMLLKPILTGSSCFLHDDHVSRRAQRSL
jgi:hypothetical protein